MRGGTGGTGELALQTSRAKRLSLAGQCATPQPWRKRLCFGALLVGVFGCGQRGKQNASSDTGSTSAAAANTEVAWRWDASAPRSYAVKLESEVAVGPGQPLVAFALEGHLNVQLRPLGSETVQFISWMPDATFTKASAQNEDFAKLATELARPIGFTTNAGALQSVNLDKTWSNFAASIGRALTSPFQLPATLPAQGQFGATELDATGKHEAQYERLLSCPVDVCLTKAKVRYSTLPLPAVQFGNLTASLKPEVQASTGRVQLSKLGVLQAFVNDERIKIPMGPAATVLSHTTIDLTLQANPELTALDWDRALEETRRLDADAPYLGPMKTTYDVLRIGDYTFDSALTELVRLAGKARSEFETDPTTAPPTTGTDPKALQEWAAPFRAMAAILRSQPERIPQAVGVVEQKSLASRSLIDALAMAGTEATTDALVGLQHSPKLSSDWRGAVTSGIVRSGDTRPAVVAALEAVLNESDLRVHALYGLGTLCRKLAEQGETARADAIARVLVQQLERAPNNLVKAHALRGISNSGRPLAIAAVAKQLTEKDANVRAAAAQALRLMKDERADNLLAETLLHDKDKTVRRAAAEAAAERTPNDALSLAVQNAVTSDPDPKVRKQLVDVLTKWLPTRPELAATLALVAADDKRPSIRDQAADSADAKPL